MGYVDEVLELVSKKNADQPEFLQAVTEVMESLRPVVEANEDLYRKNAILERITEPDKKRQHQNDRCSYDHQQTFQNLHFCSSFQRSRYCLHRASASLSSSSVTSRLPLVSSISR